MNILSLLNNSLNPPPCILSVQNKLYFTKNNLLLNERRCDDLVVNLHKQLSCKNNIGQLRSSEFMEHHNIQLKTCVHTCRNWQIQNIIYSRGPL